MIAIALREDTLEGDLVRRAGPGSGGIEMDEGLETLVTTILFTDVRVTADELAAYGWPKDTDRRGWWFDPTFGSRLWLLRRAKQRLKTLQDAREFAEAALTTWLVEQGAARSVSVTTAWARPELMALEIVITRPDGRRFDGRWEFQLGKDS